MFSVKSPIAGADPCGEKQLCSQLGRETATVSTAIECVPVAVRLRSPQAAEAKQDKCCCAVEPKDIIGQNIMEVSENGSARSPSQTAIVEKHPIQFSTREYEERDLRTDSLSTRNGHQTLSGIHRNRRSS
ncbi:MAG: hypothetical protein EBE86_015120 [Hormoscilla sp. GUM202]|nr:hypothetical protein [Hormoscilla sp. GUM202]